MAGDRFHGRGNGSEERGARAQRPLPPPNLCRCRPAPTPQTLRPVGAMTGGPGDREQRPEPTCGLHGGSLSVRKLNSRTRPRARSPLRTFLKALKKRGRPPFCPLATSCRRIRTPTYAHVHHGPQRSERGGARYVLENLGDRVGPVPLADGLALADSHLCCKRHVWLVTALPLPPKRPVLPRVALGTLQRKPRQVRPAASRTPSWQGQGTPCSEDKCYPQVCPSLRAKTPGLHRGGGEGRGAAQASEFRTMLLFPLQLRAWCSKAGLA